MIHQEETLSALQFLCPRGIMKPLDNKVGCLGNCIESQTHSGYHGTLALDGVLNSGTTTLSFEIFLNNFYQYSPYKVIRSRQ